MKNMTLLGDESVALGAVDAGLMAAYSYPGTPATEILESLMSMKQGPLAKWCSNEKTAFETALGTSFSGHRALVSMKHVGLNVAADPFMNASVVKIHGGLVVVVADDPGMHSSQNEQDTRFYADFAKTICLEPSDQQEAYDMTREAFELSERFGVPVVLRLVTRVSHGRSLVTSSTNRKNAESRGPVTDTRSWILMPAISRQLWASRINEYSQLVSWSNDSTFNTLQLSKASHRLGVITTGLAKSYYLEIVEQLPEQPSHLHIGAYPLPVAKIRELHDHVDQLLIIEEGYPFVERSIGGLLSGAKQIRGKLTGDIPPTGELTPEIVAHALGLEQKPLREELDFKLPKRPPQLCAGCPHIDTFTSIKNALGGFEKPIVTADIGCYTLGALPPFSIVDSVVCMGASIGMARGAADTGMHPVVAVIGDSTFLHSGIPPLIDAVSCDANITLIIVDNDAVAMTGGQTTILPSSRLQQLISGIGVAPEHFHVLKTHRTTIDDNAEVIRKEAEHRGLSVIIMVRECLETAKRKK